ncbi:MAG: hypothetical protein J5767_01930 [Paludibacteraceae bacterium]|nr:hypothetical protein [Paludibacteraceae bacterium]
MMTPKRMLFRLAVRGLEKIHDLHGEKSCIQFNLPLEAKKEADNVDLITIAFNNPIVIENQINCVRKHIEGNYTYIVADNSSNLEESKKIMEICKNEGISYIRIPKNHLNLIGPSYSHAAALNWTYKHVVKNRKPTYFGFIDHDLFPVKNIDVKSLLKDQPVYGVKRERGEKKDKWYLSAIMFFFNFSYLQGKKVDFMPVQVDGDYLDSGGGNWYDIYSRINRDNIKFATEYLEDFREGGLRHQDQVEIFDRTWLHTINGSYWKKVESKDNLIEELIKQYEEKLG